MNRYKAFRVKKRGYKKIHNTTFSYKDQDVKRLAYKDFLEENIDRFASHILKSTKFRSRIEALEHKIGIQNSRMDAFDKVIDFY
jgi:hypothetical protein